MDKEEKIINSIISYLNFIKEFKKIRKDHIINIEYKDNETKKYSYIFREFKVETYLINKELNAINFDELFEILDDPISEENKKKAIKELKQYLNENPFTLNEKNLKFFSELKEMKEEVENINNISFINEELLSNGMGINKDILEGKKFQVSKNKNDLCLINISKNFTLIIKTDKKNIDENEIKNFKNLYYVEDLTKKIFILLYINEQRIKYKYKKQIKNTSKFKKYYLINKDWLERYKKFFFYDLIIRKFKNIYNKVYNDEEDKEKLKIENNNEEDEDKELYSYENITDNIDEIVRKIGQIGLYNETQVEYYIRDFSNLIPRIILTGIQRKPLKKDLIQEYGETEFINNYLETPSNFYLINKDILELLLKEEFFFNIKEEFIKKIEYKIAIGNYSMIIKNKKLDIDDNKNNNENDFLVYIDKEEKPKYLVDEELREGETYVLYYTLNYNKYKYFVNDIKMLNTKKGLYNFISKYNIDLNTIKNEENFNDNKGNNLGNFINVRINKDYINNNINECENKNKTEKIDESNKFINNNIQVNEINFCIKKEIKKYIFNNDYNNYDNNINNNYHILTNELNKLKIELNNQMKKYNDLLKENQKKDKLIENLHKLLYQTKKKLSRFPFELKEGEKLMTLNFCSLDESLNNYSIICKNTDIFNTIEKKIYYDYKEFYNTNNYFTHKGHKIDRLKSLDENKIRNNDVIILNMK